MPAGIGLRWSSGFRGRRGKGGVEDDNHACLIGDVGTSRRNWCLQDKPFCQEATLQFRQCRDCLLHGKLRGEKAVIEQLGYGQFVSLFEHH